MNCLAILPLFMTHEEAPMNEERDYIGILADALNGLRNIPEKERSEEVGETIDAAIEDIDDVLTWLRASNHKRSGNQKRFVMYRKTGETND